MKIDFFHIFLAVICVIFIIMTNINLTDAMVTRALLQELVANGCVF